MLDEDIKENELLMKRQNSRKIFWKLFFGIINTMSRIIVINNIIKIIKICT